MSNNEQSSRRHHPSGMEAFFHQQMHPGNSFERFPIPYQNAAMSFPTFPHTSYNNFIPSRSTIPSNTLPSIGNFADPLSFIPYPSHVPSGQSGERRERLPEFSSIVSSGGESSSKAYPYHPDHLDQIKQQASSDPENVPQMYLPSSNQNVIPHHNPVTSPALSDSSLSSIPTSQTPVSQSYLTTQYSQQYIANRYPTESDYHYGTNSSSSTPSHVASSPHPAYLEPNTREPMSGLHRVIPSRRFDGQKHESDEDVEKQVLTSTPVRRHYRRPKVKRTTPPNKQKNLRPTSKPLVTFRLLGKLENREPHTPTAVSTCDVAIQTGASLIINKATLSKFQRKPYSVTNNDVHNGETKSKESNSTASYNILSTTDIDEYEQSSKSSKKINGSAKSSEGKRDPIKENSEIKQEDNLDVLKPKQTFSPRVPQAELSNLPCFMPAMLGSIPLAAFKGKDKEAEMERMEINVSIDESQYVSVGDGPKRWKCNQCPKSYTTKHNLVTHYLDHNGIKPHLCMICGKYFKQLSHLNTHMLTHENVKPNICPICGKGFTQVSHLKRHQTVHQENKPHICDVCGRGFAYPSELRIHKERHIPGKEKCLECDEEFDTPKQLKEHLATHESKEDLECPECNRLFRYPSQLKDHLKSHSGHRPFICPECGMDFIKEHHLKAHQFTHTGLRPYECPQCGRSFNQRANMVRHQLIHSNDRAYKCDECEKSFTQPQTLKAHMIVHADKKPHQCNLCGKEFGRQHNLQAHMHMHSDSKPFLCFCGSSFTLKGNLKRHKKVKHGIDDNTESMEEEAVSFLSTMSVRANQGLSITLPTDANQDSDNSLDNSLDNSQSGLISPDEKSHRKQRKSIPRKIPRDSESPDEDQEQDQQQNQQDQSDQDLDKDKGINHRSRFFTGSNHSFGQRSGKLLAMKRSYDKLGYEEENDQKSHKRTKANKAADNSDDEEDDDDDGDDADYEEDDDEEEGENDNDDEWTPLVANKHTVTKGKKLASVLAEKFSSSK